MRIRKPGKVNERIWFFGREESGVYLLEGNNSSMIVSGGMSYIVSDLLQQLKEFGIDENRIKTNSSLPLRSCGHCPLLQAASSRDRSLCLGKRLGDPSDG